MAGTGHHPGRYKSDSAVKRLGGAAIGEGVPDRVRKYPVFVWSPSVPRPPVCLVILI